MNLQGFLPTVYICVMSECLRTGKDIREPLSEFMQITVMAERKTMRILTGFHIRISIYEKVFEGN